jgi:ABC-type antimicrobial peptide transport system permease subunit
MFVNDIPLDDARDLSFVVRSVANRRFLEDNLRAELRSLDPGLFAKFVTLDEAIGKMDAGPRFNAVLLASFASVALLMAMVGVYGILSFAVVQRSREMGIRIALGAAPRGIVALIMREGGLLVAVGSAAGLCASLVATRWLKALLYGVSAADPATYVAVVAGLSAAAAVACYLPARRAALADPLSTLRQD